MDGWDLEADVVVVGAGGCGLMATFAAARAGAEVILLEKDTKLGCNTALADAEYIGAQGNTGDGIRWGMALGAVPLDHVFRR